MRVFKGMGNHRLYKIECIHLLGMPEFERLKVYRPESFPPDRPSPFPKSCLFDIMTQPLEGEGKGEGWKDQNERPYLRICRH